MGERPLDIAYHGQEWVEDHEGIPVYHSSAMETKRDYLRDVIRQPLYSVVAVFPLENQHCHDELQAVTPHHRPPHNLEQIR